MSEEMSELAAYFYEHVFLAYDRYKQTKNDHSIGNNKDRRDAIDAAVVLYHLREHVPESFRKTRDQLAALCPDYDLLGDIVNAAKHSVITRGTPQITRLDAIQEFLVSTRFSDQNGEYANDEKIVEVELVNGSRRDVYEILTNVVNMWFEELHRIGAIEQRQPIQWNRQGLVSRENASDVSLQMTAGIRWKQSFRPQKYNYELNKVESVDLSDAENIIFTVRKPPTFEVELHDDSGVKFTREIQLTSEQAKGLKQINDPGQRDQYLLKIAVDQGVAEQMVAEYQNAQNKEQTTEKVSKPFFKNWFVWLALIGLIGMLPFILFGIFLGYQFIVQLPKAEKAHTQLEIEFKTITPLPNASVVKYDSSYKESNALVGATYSTNISSDDIFNYYNAQLKQHGWQFQGTEGLKDWGRDLGGKSADYCKGDYAASIQYAGEQAHYGWTYAFSMSWGLHDCKTKSEGSSLK